MRRFSEKVNSRVYEERDVEDEKLLSRPDAAGLMSPL